MAQNRRKSRMRVNGRKQQVRGVVPGSLVGVLTVLAIMAFVYLYIGGRCELLGEKITELEKRHEQVRRDIANEDFKWARMMSPDNMEKLIQKHNLNMIWPPVDSVVRLRRNPPPQLLAHQDGLGDLIHD